PEGRTRVRSHREHARDRRAVAMGTFGYDARHRAVRALRWFRWAAAVGALVPRNRVRGGGRAPRRAAGSGFRCGSSRRKPGERRNARRGGAGSGRGRRGGNGGGTPRAGRRRDGRDGRDGGFRGGLRGRAPRGPLLWPVRTAPRGEVG